MLSSSLGQLTQAAETFIALAMKKLGSTSGHANQPDLFPGL
jgi:hypothetical protein